MSNKTAYIIIGAGIVGLATAYTLLEKSPSAQVTVLEKEADIAQHQTSHNSGVIHSGIYYKPGSLKAKNCVLGVKKLLAFCDRFDIPYELCGKVIVATSPDEIPALNELYSRGLANQVPDLRMINSKELHQIEPYAAGVMAIHSPKTGIVNYFKVAQKLREEIIRKGGEVVLNQQVKQIIKNKHDLIIKTQDREYLTQYCINCAGLYSDKIARQATKNISEKIIPFRGEYYFLKPEKRKYLKGLIYPVPNPKFPFLGVHMTKRLNGEVEVGPNAVLAFAKEGYRKRDIHLKEIQEYLTFSGFWSLVRNHWKMGMYEFYRSYSKKKFLKDAQKLMPDLKEDDLIPGGSGVRAQSVGPKGQLIDDFLIKSSENQTHVINAPSPAATSCLAIANTLVEQIDSNQVSL